MSSDIDLEVPGVTSARTYDDSDAFRTFDLTDDTGKLKAINELVPFTDEELDTFLGISEDGSDVNAMVLPLALADALANSPLVYALMQSDVEDE